MNQIFKKIARFFLGDYSPYYIYHWESNAGPFSSCEHESLDVRLLDDATLKSCDDPRIQEHFGYCGPESLCFGCFLSHQLVGVCFYWFGDRYRKRNFWPLKEWEAKLVQIIVTPEMRGRGVATFLIRCSAVEIERQGFAGLYARIWHSNHPSLRAFERAGWRRVAFVAEINPFRTAHPIRIRKNF